MIHMKKKTSQSDNVSSKKVERSLLRQSIFTCYTLWLNESLSNDYYFIGLFCLEISLEASKNESRLHRLGNR